MLRFLTLTSLRLLIAFTGIGLLICKQWGWPEYASPELYVLYSNRSFDYFIINANGGSAGQPLSGNDGNLMQLACSPDGRILAALTELSSSMRHLYIVNAKGIVYDRKLDVPFDLSSVANNGSAALALQNTDGNMIVEPDGDSYWVDAPSNTFIQISSLRTALLLPEYVTPNDGVAVAFLRGNPILFLEKFTSPTWLASEDILSAYNTSTGHQYFVDMATRELVELHRQAAILSPDGTLVVDWITSDNTAQLIVYNFLAPNTSKRELTHNPQVSSYPICFLTFRPQMLLADNP